MPGLSFLFGVFCLLQTGFAKEQQLLQPSPPVEGGISYVYAATPVKTTQPPPPVESGITYEYTPTPVKTDPTDLFTARLAPTSGTNVSVLQFMYHFKYTLYASAFLVEIFTLGIGMHLYTNDEMDDPSDEERRVAIAVGKVWQTLAGVRAVNNITLRVCTETARQYLRSKERKNTLRFAFSELDKAVLANPSISKAYSEEKKKLETVTLPPLHFVGIDLKKFIAIDRMLVKKVWPEPKTFPLIAHERFSQHVETPLNLNATGDDYDNVVLAYVLVDAASIPDLKESAEKAYEEGVADAVEKSSEFLKLTKLYDQFDQALFNSINIAIKSYPKLDEKVMEMKKAYPAAPKPEA